MEWSRPPGGSNNLFGQITGAWYCKQKVLHNFSLGKSFFLDYFSLEPSCQSKNISKLARFSCNILWISQWQLYRQIWEQGRKIFNVFVLLSRKILVPIFKLWISPASSGLNNLFGQITDTPASCPDQTQPILFLGREEVLPHPIPGEGGTSLLPGRSFELLPYSDTETNRGAISRNKQGAGGHRRDLLPAGPDNSSYRNLTFFLLVNSCQSWQQSLSVG